MSYRESMQYGAHHCYVGLGTLILRVEWYALQIGIRRWCVSFRINRLVSVNEFIANQVAVFVLEC
jgi:hypothetical protein